MGYACVTTVVYDNRPRDRHNWCDNLFFRSLEYKNLVINLLVVSVEQCCTALKFCFAVISNSFDSEHGVFMDLRRESEALTLRCNHRTIVAILNTN